MKGTLSSIIAKNHQAGISPDDVARKQQEIETLKQQDKQLRQEWLFNPTTQQTIKLLEQLRDQKIKTAISHSSRKIDQDTNDAAFEAGVLDKTINLLKTGEYSYGS